MEQERIAFVYELYTQSAGDACQGIPDDVLIDALRFGEAVTERIQCEFQQEGCVALTTVPPSTAHICSTLSRRSACQPKAYGPRGTSTRHGTRHLPICRRPLVRTPRSDVCTPWTAVLIGGVPRPHSMKGNNNATRRQ
jgi:hypothetical protein